jgi:hypothetical protein
MLNPELNFKRKVLLAGMLLPVPEPSQGLDREE